MVVQVPSHSLASTLHDNPIYDPDPDPLEASRSQGLALSPVDGAHSLYAVVWDHSTAGDVVEAFSDVDVYATWSLQTPQGLETGRGVGQPQLVLAGEDDRDREWGGLYERYVAEQRV